MVNQSKQKNNFRRSISPQYASALAILACDCRPGLGSKFEKLIINEIKEYVEKKHQKEATAVAKFLMGKKGKYTNRVMSIGKDLQAWVAQLGGPKKRSCSHCHGNGWIES